MTSSCWQSAARRSASSEESSGVIAMIDTLIKGLDTEMTEAETNEKLNQEDYEEMMADSAAKRAADSKSLAQREGAKADNLSNVKESLVDDKKFLAELQKSCATKEKEWAEICKTRSEELLALADTINILNDDDALELFKKTLPGASSFLQVEVSTAQVKSQAWSMISERRRHSLRSWFALHHRSGGRRLDLRQ